MSRIIIKNLPSRTTEVRLREQFSKCGVITDVKLMKTQRGVFRRFAFIGYASDSQAQAAVEHFNKTFINATKIEVETAKPYGDDSLNRPWSKYSKGSSAFNKLEKQTGKEQNKTKAFESKLEKQARESSAERVVRECESDPSFQEFMDAHQHKREVWADGTSKKAVKGQHVEEKKEVQEEENEQVADEQVGSDMDYLRSKMITLSEQVDTSSSQSDSDDETKPTQETETPNTTPFTIKMLGLPFSVREKGIREFFQPIALAAVRLTTDSEGRPSGRAYVDFNSEADLRKGLKRNKDCIGHRYIELFRDTGPQTGSREQITEPHKRWTNVSGVESVEDVSESGRLFVRNLPYSATEDDLTQLFDKFGPLTEVAIPLDKTTNKPMGFAFVTFMLPEHAVRAFEAIDGQIFQGRLIHLLPAKPRESREPQDQQGSSYKTSKLRKSKSESGKGHNWNTLFLGANAVVDAIADKYSIDKSDVLDAGASESSAVRLALGETQLVTETRAFMESRGVQLEMFGNDKCKRSKTIILVKNLPFGTTEPELVQLFEPFGQLSQIILPPAGVSALVEFAESVHARSAFQQLAYTSFKHLPLYLEWAPEAVIQHKEKEKSGVEEAATERSSERACVFVKNLNFSSTETGLEELMGRAGRISSVSIARKRNMKDPTKPLSMGYGFVEYSTPKAALKAIRRLQHSELDGHKLELKLSIRQVKTESSGRKSSKPTDQISGKILVRNIPFEASKAEVRELFQTFGTLKTIRLPKKLGSSQSEHRGFGFVEFSTKEDAKRAFDSLCQSTHLYGRRLVLEWAEQEESVEAIRKRTAEHFHLPSGKKQFTEQSLLSSLDR